MAKSSPAKKAWRSLTWLGVIIVGLIALNTAGVLTGGGSWTPKLALDLEGGTQIILAPKLESGQSVSSEQLNEAVKIIRQRIDSAGVSEAEINTQGGQNIVVSIPGVPDDATINRIESSAKLEFRPVLVAGAPSAASVGENVVGEDGVATPVPTPTVDPSLESTPTAVPTDGSDLNWITPALQAQYEAFDCSKIDTTNVAPAAEPLVTCEADGSIKYILGPVEVSGENVSDATNGQQTTQSGATTGEWVVNITFDGTGTKAFADVSTRLNALTAAQNQFAIVLDGNVISAPRTLAAITDGNAQISGDFDQDSSKALADQLKFGALPISFTVQSQDTISATLGSSQLTGGLIAGLIGLVLVVLYSLIQYRLLGLVTVASLTVAAIITYLLITILSWREGYRLSLAGVAGLIVAIGITADSFIVYFERVRDELRDGRGLESSVEAGWKRALRTILASDAVNILAAGVLFIVAVGNVKGFALTLGLTTLVDVLVVMLFTHPMLQLLARTKFFSDGHKFSGLDPRALGATYRGRAKFRPSDDLPSAKLSSASREAAKRQTIAERKASELVGSSADRTTDGKDS
ncbi:protein translocase subunit SecD [Cryobacterium sp. TMT1-62]|uniref:Protein translocase subunit SecD n=1 Tax=Cryobacterium sandaracinum TaxID=1259247 RepID=A0ABY2JKY5_9MICO|nr:MULTISPECIES: protein translocase subunit SecD [Cryobacterium]TFB53776.1 protein translocase subunit SecD [Cryobacterium sp. Sr3]TFB57905.1 protein translocase subunit SecD [Cryobacterium sp. Hz7]TFC39405.1 protein translocase subunit SecD [Cryobacterium sp. TMT2-14]TFC49347.1 protein translocase subunit SecD [Cryobacterium sp. TMT2-17-1]TFC70786.1 protein translocase subunit SecD [Cryobacterium sp. TMT2-4]